MVTRAPVRLPLRLLEALDVAALPGSFDAPLVKVLADLGDCLPGCNTVEDRQTGQRGAGPAPPADAGHLDPLLRGPLPCLSEGGLGIVAVRSRRHDHSDVSADPQVLANGPPDRLGDADVLLGGPQ